MLADRLVGRNVVYAPERPAVRWALIVVAAIVLSLATIYVQVMALEFKYIEQGNQILRHRAVLDGTSGDPWQYRVLSEYLVEGVLQAYARLHAPRPILLGFVGFRLLQNLLLFALAAAYWRRLRLNVYSTLLGLGVLAWSMTHMLYDSDLSLNTYTDAIAYLAAALLILAGRWWAVVPLTALAALNRETSGLIPVMLLAVAATEVSPDRRRRGYLVGMIALAVFGVTYLGLRYAYGPRPAAVGLTASPLQVNLLNPHAWAQMILAFGVLPLLVFLSFRAWPRPLKTFFWAVVPIWTAVHLLYAHMAETRLFLVPLALVFVPGALYGVERSLLASAGILPASEADAGREVPSPRRADSSGSAAA